MRPAFAATLCLLSLVGFLLILVTLYERHFGACLLCCLAWYCFWVYRFQRWPFVKD